MAVLEPPYTASRRTKMAGILPDIMHAVGSTPLVRLNTIGRGLPGVIAAKTVRPVLDIIRRQSSFDEVQGGLDENNALFEARRCLSCGNCFECDNCYGVCPDNAVIKLGPGMGFEFNLDYCKGCGICAQECPCGAIQMIPEAI